MTHSDDVALSLIYSMNFLVDSDCPEVDAVPARVVCCEMLAPRLRDFIAAIAAGRFDV